MLRLNFLLILFFDCVSGVSLAQSYNFGFDKYTVLDVVSNNRISLPLDNNKKLIIFLFLSPECPLCQKYTVQMKEIGRTYKNELELFGIFPGVSYSRSDLMDFKKKYSIDFSLFMDDQFTLTNSLSVKVTPTAVLINNNNHIAYIGAIDDWAITLGNTRKAATKNYLVNAIKECLNNQDVSLVSSEPVGCEINVY
ncbi:Thiol-disulfide isomerase or thioredoxin [bacterium A37T11]|nr:Thiol-disulfide isomerase or thioredoxin [bacterium A37T11]